MSHSLSPALHTAAYEALGLDWQYEPVEVTPDALPGFLAGLDDSWVGLSLTMPLKQTVLPLLDEVSLLARATGAANTVLLGPVRRGDNTDVAGIVAALAEIGVRTARAGVVLGGGATAASALAALLQLGESRPRVLVRDPSHAAPLLSAAGRLGSHPQVDLLRPDALLEADVVVSTLPSGAADTLTPPAGTTGALLDVVYAPWPTVLAERWPGPAVGGGVMLLHQAAAQVELMTGRSAPLEAMRRALPSGLLAGPVG